MSASRGGKRAADQDRIEGVAGTTLTPSCTGDGNWQTWLAQTQSLVGSTPTPCTFPVDHGRVRRFEIGAVQRNWIGAISHGTLVSVVQHLCLPSRWGRFESDMFLHPHVAKRKTRTAKDRVGATPWRFESSYVDLVVRHPRGKTSRTCVGWAGPFGDKTDALIANMVWFLRKVAGL